MAHFKKYHISDVKKLLEHDNRTNTDERENVDKTRSHLNYNLHDIKEEYKFFRDKLEFVKNNGGTVRADSVVMISEIVTLPEDFSDDVKEQEKFFKGVYELAIKKHGKENIISAWVHCDEAKKKDSDTLNKPHIHLKFLPIVKTKKKYKNGTEKERLALNANKILTPEFLGNFHNELDEFLENYLGYKTSVHTGITKEQGGHKTVPEMKEITKKIYEKKKELKELEEKIEKTKKVSSPNYIEESRKRILNEFWQEYKEISKKYWNNYKMTKDRIKGNIWELKKEIYGTEKQLQNDLDFVSNLSHGLFYALFKLIGGLFIYNNKKTLQKELEALENNLKGLDNARRSISNYQHNTKENLKKADLEKIEIALEKWENAIIGINEGIMDEMIKREPEKEIEKEYER